MLVGKEFENLKIATRDGYLVIRAAGEKGFELATMEGVAASQERLQPSMKRLQRSMELEDLHTVKKRRTPLPSFVDMPLPPPPPKPLEDQKPWLKEDVPSIFDYKPHLRGISSPDLYRLSNIELPDEEER